MRYMIKDSFGDAYRTTSVTSSLILGLAGSATLVIGIAVVVMSGSTLVSIYSQMRTGNGWRAETTPVRPLARRLRLDSTRRDLLEVIVGASIPVMLGVYFSDVVGPFAGYIWADMEMLDGDHAMVGYILGQMIVYIVLLVAMQLNEANWWRRRLRGERERVSEISEGRCNGFHIVTGFLPGCKRLQLRELSDSDVTHVATT